jgi:hypothetical protein
MWVLSGKAPKEKVVRYKRTTFFIFIIGSAGFESQTYFCAGATKNDNTPQSRAENDFPGVTVFYLLR